jgi:hypothetical protein
MDASLKELAKLEKLANAKDKGPSISSTLDSLLQTLHHVQAAIQTGEPSPESFIALGQAIEAKKKDIDERQKEVYSATSRFGKALDRVRGLLDLHYELTPSSNLCRVIEVSDAVANLFRSLQLSKVSFLA